MIETIVFNPLLMGAGLEYVKAEPVPNEKKMTSALQYIKGKMIFLHNKELFVQFCLSPPHPKILTARVGGRLTQDFHVGNNLSLCQKQRQVNVSVVCSGLSGWEWGVEQGGDGKIITNPVGSVSVQSLG